MTTRVLEGGCHCGAVRFRVTVDTDEIVECNCSICAKKGYLHLIVTKDAFTLVQGETSLHEYRFGTRTARHFFCPTCGIAPYYIPRSHPDGIDVNARCLDAGTDGFRVRPFDGQHWEENVAKIR